MYNEWMNLLDELLIVPGHQVEKTLFHLLDKITFILIQFNLDCEQEKNQELITVTYKINIITNPKIFTFDIRAHVNRSSSNQLSQPHVNVITFIVTYFPNFVVLII